MPVLAHPSPLASPTPFQNLAKFSLPGEVATYLKIPKKTVYKMLQTGELRAFKAGKHWRVSRDNLGAWIAYQSQKNGEHTK